MRSLFDDGAHIDRLVPPSGFSDGFISAGLERFIKADRVEADQAEGSAKSHPPSPHHKGLKRDEKENSRIERSYP
jgi:hypothetical protein